MNQAAQHVAADVVRAEGSAFRSRPAELPRCLVGGLALGDAHTLRVVGRDVIGVDVRSHRQNDDYHADGGQGFAPPESEDGGADRLQASGENQHYRQADHRYVANHRVQPRYCSEVADNVADQKDGNSGAEKGEGTPGCGTRLFQGCDFQIRILYLIRAKHGHIYPCL